MEDPISRILSTGGSLLAATFLGGPLHLVFEITGWCRFNGAQFLRKYRGKKIMFVGDSLSYNMWISLSCMIHSWVPNAKYTLVKTGGSILTDLTFQ
ncbi:trichome birefringence-like protein 39, partial [Tanacetum coccineum]